MKTKNNIDGNKYSVSYFFRLFPGGDLTEMNKCFYTTFLSDKISLCQHSIFIRNDFDINFIDTSPVKMLYGTVWWPTVSCTLDCSFNCTAVQYSPVQLITRAE